MSGARVEKTLLRVLIDQNGWQEYRSFVRKFRAAAADLAENTGEPGLATVLPSQSSFERWYASRATPQTEARQILEHLFCTPIARLLSPADSHVDACAATAEASVPRESPASPRSGRDSLERTTNMAAQRAIRFAMDAEQREAGPETLDHLLSEVRRLSELYNRVPLAHVLDDLTTVQDDAFRLIESNRARPTQMRDLYLLASLASGMLAKASHDLRDPRSAMMQARTAAVCAAQAEHTTMTAWVRGLQSLISYWAGRPEDARHYASEGFAGATSPGGSVTVWLSCLEGRAAAVLGDQECVRAADLRASELRDHVVADDLDNFGGNFTFPAVRQAYYQVEAAVLVGRGGRALLGEAEAAVRGYGDTSSRDWSFGDEAGARTNLSLARLHTDDLDGAADAVAPVLDLPVSKRNAGIVRSIERVQQALSHGPVREARTARDLRAEISAFGSRVPMALS